MGSGNGKVSSTAIAKAASGPARGEPASFPASEDAKNSAKQGADMEKDVAPPLVYVEVNIEPGKPPERLVLREGQTPAEAAAEFAVTHHLPPQLAQRLHEHLKVLLMNPDLQAMRRAGQN
jgi:hypothetical protein